MKRIFSILLLLITSTAVFAQDVKLPAGSKLTMYVEYGGKGIKLGVLAYTDPGYRKFVVVDSRELNVGLSKSIQSSGKITPQDISSATASSYDAYQQLLSKYKDLGLADKNVIFYVSSGVAVAQNLSDLTDAIKAKTNHQVLVVKDAEESKYTIAGTIPFDKIDNALVLDQGGSNTKGGYVIKDGKSLTGVPLIFDLGSVRVADLIVSNYMTTQPDDPNDYRKAFVDGMNKAFDSLRVVIKRTFSNIEGAESRNELYLSGGAAYAVTTLLYPESDPKQQMVEISLDRLRAFQTEIQDRDSYRAIKDKTFSDEKVQKSYKNALSIYTQLQLISATKLLITYINALGGDDKKIYFNRYGLHAMPSMLISRVLRGER